MYTTSKGQAQAIGEYLSAQALHASIPDNVPRPVAVGVLSRDPSKHFLICEFVDLLEEMPPVAEFAGVLARLHRNSASPTGQFGFDVPTSQSLQLQNNWSDSWEEFFTRAFLGTVKLELEIHAEQHEKMGKLAQQMCEKVIPRLLRPMEINGRKLKPTLVHGDLWHGNVGINILTDQVIFFDCCSFYGHHEYDLGMFRASRFRTNKSHVRAYHKLIEISYPPEDHDDRNALYALRVDLETSCAWPANKRTRELAMAEMQRLIEKYPEGFDGWEEQQGASDLGNKENTVPSEGPEASMAI